MPEYKTEIEDTNGVCCAVEIDIDLDHEDKEIEAMWITVDGVDVSEDEFNARFDSWGLAFMRPRTAVADLIADAMPAPQEKPAHMEGRGHDAN